MTWSSMLIRTMSSMFMACPPNLLGVPALWSWSRCRVHVAQPRLIDGSPSRAPPSCSMTWARVCASDDDVPRPWVVDRAGVVAQLGEDLVRVLRVIGGRRRVASFLVEEDGRRREAHWTGRVLHLAKEPVRNRLGIVEHLAWGLDRRPYALGRDERLLPLLQRALGEDLVEDPDAFCCMLLAIAAGLEARVGGEVWAPKMLAEVHPFLVEVTEHAQIDEAVVLRPVHVHRGVVRLARGDRTRERCPQSGRDDCRTVEPGGRPHQP